MRFCENCGEGNSNDSEYCIQCGMSLAGKDYPVAGPSPVPAPPFPALTYQPVHSPAPADGMAVASLVLSIFSFMGCLFLPAIAGVILGHVSLRRISTSGGSLGGAPLARAGLIIGWINIGLVLLAAAAAVTVLLLFSSSAFR